MEVESVESLCQRARQAIAQGGIEEARHIYMEALDLKSDAPDVHYGLATVCFLLNDLESAAYHFKEVTRLDPIRPGAHINLGAVYNRLEEHQNAIKALRRGIQLDPKRAEGYYNLGLVYRNMGQHNLAVQSYLEATRVNPRMIDAHYNLANVYLETERYKQAATHYRQVLQLRPNWDKAVHGLEQAEAAQKEIESPEKGAEPAAAAAVLPPISPDSDRHVDPNLHGLLLTHLHQATIDTELQGRQLALILEQQVDPALKELSTCLLRANSPAHVLDQCVEKFENAVQMMRRAQRQIQSTMEQVRSLGERLINT
jgi:tetratricopeptide (TPR) repeat protein